MIGGSDLDPSDDCPDAVDPDRSVVLERRAEAPNDRTCEQLVANGFLGVTVRSSVEPFIEVEHELFLDQADVCEAGAGEQIDQLTGREVARVRAVARHFEHAVMSSDGRVWISDVIANDDHAVMTNQRGLPRQKGVRVDDMMHYKSR